MIMLVARREIAVRSRTKGFRIGLAVTVALVALLAMVPKLLSGSDYTVGLAGAAADRFQAALTAQAAQDEELTFEFRRYPDEAAAERAVADGEVEAAVVDGKVYTQAAVGQNLSVLLNTAHRTVAAESNLQAAGLDPAKVGQALQVAPLTVVSLEGDAENAGLRAAIATVIVVILFMLLIQICTWVAMGVVEEKGSRIVEILLASLRPWQLLAGKVVGLGVLGFVQIVAIAGAGLAVVRLTGSIPDLPEGTYGVVAMTIVWFLLGYLFFAAMYAAMASLVSRQEEVSGVLTPATILLMAGYFVGFITAQDPGTSLARVLSIVPPFSSMVMPVRSAVVAVPLWEIALAMGLMLVAAAVVLLAGGKIYERAVARTGARVKIRDLFGKAA